MGSCIIRECIQFSICFMEVKIILLVDFSCKNCLRNWKCCTKYELSGKILEKAIRQITIKKSRQVVKQCKKLIKKIKIYKENEWKSQKSYEKSQWKCFRT